jgi:hypothetical protein
MGEQRWPTPANWSTPRLGFGPNGHVVGAGGTDPKWNSGSSYPPADVGESLRPQAFSSSGFESCSAPRQGRISSRCTKVLITVLDPLVTSQIAWPCWNGEPSKEASSPLPLYQNNGKRSKDGVAVLIDKQIFNTLVQRLGRIWALGGEGDPEVKANVRLQARAACGASSCKPLFGATRAQKTLL